MKCISTRLACSQGRSNLARASSTVAVHRATKISSRARAKTVAASCSDNRVVIELPDGMHPAAVIGRKAENLKLLQRRSGAHLQVPKKTATDNLNTVTITGTQQAIQAAKDLLEAQIQAYIAQGDMIDMLALGTGFPCMTEVMASAAFTPQQMLSYAVAFRILDSCNNDLPRQLASFVMQPGMHK